MCNNYRRHLSVPSLWGPSVIQAYLFPSLFAFPHKAEIKICCFFDSPDRTFPFPSKPAAVHRSQSDPGPFHKEPVCSFKGERQRLPLQGDFFSERLLSEGPCGPYGSCLTKAVLIGSSALSSAVPLFSGGWNAD